MARAVEDPDVLAVGALGEGVLEVVDDHIVASLDDDLGHGFLLLHDVGCLDEREHVHHDEFHHGGELGRAGDEAEDEAGDLCGEGLAVEHVEDRGGIVAVLTQGVLELVDVHVGVDPAGPIRVHLVELEGDAQGAGELGLDALGGPLGLVALVEHEGRRLGDIGVDALAARCLIGAVGGEGDARRFTIVGHGRAMLCRDGFAPRVGSDRIDDRGDASVVRLSQCGEPGGEIAVVDAVSLGDAHEQHEPVAGSGDLGVVVEIGVDGIKPGGLDAFEEDGVVTVQQGLHRRVVGLIRDVDRGNQVHTRGVLGLMLECAGAHFQHNRALGLFDDAGVGFGGR